MSTSLHFKSLAPILVVDAIEQVLPFWNAKLGFSLATTVPDAAPYNFVILVRDGIELMLQTKSSSAQDTGDITAHVHASVLYFSVGSIDDVLAALGDTNIAVPRRTTFYGADEVWVRDPAGNVVGFAAPPRP